MYAVCILACACMHVCTCNNVWACVCVYIFYRLFLKRNELDNLQKSKIRRLYPIQFSIEINFEAVITPRDNSLEIERS